MVANTPKFSNKMLRWVAGGWQFAPILQLKSGNHFTIYAGTDRALTTAVSTVASGVVPQPADQISTNVFDSNKGRGCPGSTTACISYLNKAAFSIPALGTYGNMRYGTLAGPGLIQLNMAVSRTFPIGEKRTLQLRG